MASVYCTQCGAVRSGTGEFCPACGHRDPAPGPAAVAHHAPAGRLPVAWGGRQVAAGVAAVALAALASAGTALAVAGRSNPALMAWLASILLGLAMLPVVWVLGPRQRHGLLPALGLAAPRQHWLLAAALTAGALGASLAFTAGYGWTMKQLGWRFLVPPEIKADIVLPGLGAVLTFQALALWTPITEEVFFRGFVFQGLLGRWGAVSAMAGSALVFSAFHLAPAVLLPVFVTGLLLAWLYHRTGSLWTAIAAHAGQNAIALAVTMYQGLDKAG